MSPTAKREAIRYTTKQYEVSERRACRAVKVPRSTVRYCTRRIDDGKLRSRLREIALKRRRFGSPRITVMLRREGFKVNHKRVERIYAMEGLQVKKRKKRRQTAALRIVIPTPTNPINGGAWILSLTPCLMVAGFAVSPSSMISPENLFIFTSTKAFPVIGSLTYWMGLRGSRGLPETIVCDNGPEFARYALDWWAHERGVRISFIRPGKPTENAFIGAFQWEISGRMSQRKLVHKLSRRSRKNRGLAKRLTIIDPIARWATKALTSFSRGSNNSKTRCFSTSPWTNLGGRSEGLAYNYDGKWGLDSQVVFDELGLSYGFQLRAGDVGNNVGSAELIKQTFRGKKFKDEKYLSGDSAYCNQECITTSLGLGVKFTFTAHEGWTGWRSHLRD